jgi:hypothetical protein
VPCNKITRTFDDGLVVHYKDIPGVKYFQSINGAPFTETYSLFTIGETSEIKAFSVNDLDQHSDTVEFKYTKIPGGRKISLNTKYENQYAAGGDLALIDGIRGSENFHTGDWQGYEGKDIDAIIDLGSEKNISHVALSCLQDQNAWIFFPSEVIFYSSSDGKNFTEIETNRNSYSQNSQTALIHEFYTDKPTKARYIKVVAKNIGTCPGWHPGKGNPAWIFADEISVIAE